MPLNLPDDAPPAKPVQSPPDPRKTNWIPSRKAISGGLAGIVTFAIVTACSYFGYPLPAELQALIPGAVTWVIYYLVPASQADVVRNLDNKIVALAIADPTSPVTTQRIATAVQVAKVDAIVESAAKQL